MTNPLNLPEARYILPDFEERTSYGFKRHNPYTKLFEDRIVFLGVQVDDASADDVMAQLLCSMASWLKNCIFRMPREFWHLQMPLKLS